MRLTTRKQKILEYVREHPGCTVAQVAEGIYGDRLTKGLVVNLYPIVRDLTAEGLIDSYRLKLNGPKFLEAPQ